MNTIKHLAITALMTLALFSFTSSQDENTITEKEKSEIIDKTISLLYENYIYPERVKNIENFLTDKLQSGGYARFVKPEEF